MDADDATSAMIAQVLAEENPYQFEDYVDAQDDPDDSDYASPVARKVNRSGQGCGRKRGARRRASNGDASAVPAAPVDDADDDSQRQSATGRRKRRDTGMRRAKGRPWTEEEEAMFLRSLELYGRDWKSCARYVGTRDAKALTSHAQKHFIKLCMRGAPLPDKVRETGTGYTLSGKPLDPTSTSAKAYGFNPHLLKELSEEAYKIALNGIIAEKLEESEAVISAAGKRRRNSSSAGPHKKFQGSPPGSDPVPDAPQKVSPSVENAEDIPMPDAIEAQEHDDTMETEQAASGKDRGRHLLDQSLSYTNECQLSEVPPQTEYSKARPRRSAPMKKVHMGQTTESLDLVKCLNFPGGMRSGSLACQPYSVEVCNQALLVMDCHAHLSECEIIGLLGGRWDPQKKHLVVMEAFPCAREIGSEARTSVELDPEAEVMARSQMQASGLQGVGWYHSHPIFEPSPSKKDMENQRNYQALFRDEESRMEPFVGFIVGPYDAQLLSPHSAMTSFIVQEKEGILKPYRIMYTKTEVSEVPQPKTIQKLQGLFDTVKTDIARVDFNETWRPFSCLKDDQPEGPALSKLQKFKLSLKSYFPEGQENEAQEFIELLCGYIETSWGMKLRDTGKKLDGE